MEQVIQFALRRIKEQIPSKILEHAFSHNTTLDLFGNAVYVNVDTAIEMAIFKNSLCLDIQVIASKHENISLEGINPIEQSDGGFVLHVPTVYTGGREIIGVNSVHFISNYEPSVGVMGESNVTNKLAKVVDGYRQQTPAMTTNCEVIAPNVIYVGSGHLMGPPTSAEVDLQVDSNLSHIPHHAYDRFAALALEKAKMLIRTRLRMKVADGAISRGMELGVVREIIDEFSGSEENFRDLLAQWRRTEIYLDPKRKLKEVSALMPK